MAFTRKFLLDNGVPEDKIDEIMAERGRTLADYVPKGDVQTQIDAALDAERKKAPTPVAATETPEYKELEGKYNMQTALASDDFAGVKPKFRETVYKMLDHSAKHKPYTEQLTDIAEKFDEYFTQQAPPPTTEPAKTPQFGAPTAGKLPGGETQPKFNDVWNFGPKKT